MQKSVHKFVGIKKNTYLCIVFVIILVTMPEIYRIYGFKIRFYSDDHEPIHVHIVGHDGVARFELQGEKFILIQSEKIKISDLSRLQKSVNENADIIIDRWHEYFDGQ